jgi:thiol-disulfide isomerase/thioredoxin
MARILLFLSALGLLLSGCETKPSQTIPLQTSGDWLFELVIEGHTIPFHAKIETDSVGTKFWVHNGAERIEADLVEVKDDSLIVQLAVFNTVLKALFLSDSTLKGAYFDYSRENYSIPLVGSKGTPRFPQLDSARVSLAGRWAVGFSPGTDDGYPAVGEFKQNGNYVEGTFLTTTGDFRFLEGTVSGDSVLLSAFDGAHALLFKARIAGDSIFGGFWSGNHWQEPWIGVRNEKAMLPNPETLTFLNPGYKRLAFSFKDIEGNVVSLSDKRFRNKVVIVQLMGSWCPNCMDETSYLVEVYKQYHAEGLEVIALAFERESDELNAIRNLSRWRTHFSIPYTILLAGSSSKDEASEKLPMLNRVLSFPTTIIIDRKMKVRRIYTGFSGPGTGEYYTDFTNRMDLLLVDLLGERITF